jgi:quercetin dioxygenase-like cupin family protein
MAVPAAFEILESPDEGARFCIAYTDTSVTVGMIILKSDGELPKHRWPLAAQYLQISGQCGLTVLGEKDEITEQHEFGPGNSLELPAETWHILTNMGDDESVLLFKITGDVSHMIEKIRKDYTAIDLEVA